MFRTAGKPFTQDSVEELIKDNIPTSRFPGKRSTWNSPSYAEGLHSQRFLVDYQRPQISELHFDKFPAPSTFSCWKIRFKTEVCNCSGSPSEAMLWIKEVEIVDKLMIWCYCVQFRGIIARFFLDAKIASACLDKESQPGGTKISNLRSMPSKTINFVHVLRVLPSDWRVMIPCLISQICSLLLFTMMTFRNSIRGGTKIYDRWQKNPTNDVLESLYKLRKRLFD